MTKDINPLVGQKKDILAICDGCGRDILIDEVALAKYGGIHCYECCKIIWEHGVEYFESHKKSNQ